MINSLKFFVTGVFLFAAVFAYGQEESFIALGDMHYDRLEDHDPDFVMTRSQDLKQIMNEYPPYTTFFMPKFLQLIKKQTLTQSPKVKAVVQLGDLVQGVSGNAALARQMNRGVVDMLYNLNLSVPWILTKGNHDVSNSPGQPEAWEEVIRPFIEGQIKKPANHGMYTYKMSEDTEFFVLDQFFSNDRMLPESEIIKFLEYELPRSKARYKFLLTHQPVIPVTERSWHLFSGIRRPVKDTTMREKFLNLLGEHKVIVLCAHLHEYSVLTRETPKGNIVQVMINSVNRGLEPPVARNVFNEYKGDEWVTEDWQPSTKEIRKKLLAEERKYVKQFYRADLPGYGIITMSGTMPKVVLSYYNGLSEEPFQQINLVDLQNNIRMDKLKE